MRNRLKPIIGSYLIMLVTMFGLDLIWLDTVAKPLYQAGIGHLLAPTPTIPFAILFYLIYIAGILHYAVWPRHASMSSTPSLKAGALFGFFVYASYDLTNLALLRDWPLKLSLIDMAWGVSLSGAMGFIGHRAWRALAK